MKTFLFPAAVLVIVAGCGSAHGASQPNLFDELFPTDPLATDRAREVRIVDCMARAGVAYTPIQFSTDPATDGTIDSRARRETDGFGISTGGMTPDDIDVRWEGPATDNNALTRCGTEVDAAMQTARDAKLATFSPADLKAAQSAETAPQIAAAWTRWQACMAKAGVTTAAHNTTELRAEIAERYSHGNVSTTLFQTDERRTAVADWDCYRDVESTVKSYLKEALS